MILASENRLKGTDRIEEIKKKGKVLQDDLFGVIYLEKHEEEKPRFGFVISTKISKLAVHRNRINRSLHEGVRRVLSLIPENYDFVFLAKKSIEKKSTEEIIKEVDSFFRNNITVFSK
jgi:ribonuclease P protein component